MRKSGAKRGARRTYVGDTRERESSWRGEGAECAQVAR